MTLLILIILCVLAFYFYKKPNRPTLKAILKTILKVIFYPILFPFPLIPIIVGVLNLSNISSEGVNFITASLYFFSSVLLILSGLSAIVFFIFKNKIKTLSSHHKKLNYINGYTTSILCFILFLSGGSLMSRTETMQGELLGFPPSMDFAEAKRHNIYNVDEYSKFLAEKKAKEKAEQDRIEAEQAKKDAECVKDAYCYYTTHNSAEYECSKEIQGLAKYKFEWTDKFYEKKFTASRWIDQNKKIVQIFGDRATAQNGFGAIQNASYSCIFNADTGEVLHATLN